MSIAALAVSDVVIAGQVTAATSAPVKKAPKYRTITANSDAVAQPEAR